MATNWSSSCVSLPRPPSVLSSGIMLQQQLECLWLHACSPNMIMVMLAYIILMFPLNVLVLYLSHRRWRRRPPSATSMSHSDLLTVHMSLMELINVLWVVLSGVGVYTSTAELVTTGITVATMNLIGVMIFHILTCVERHLAVVYPVTYLGLKNARGIRMRNVTIGAVWLLSFGGCSSVILSVPTFTAVWLCLLGLDLIILCFCSLSVLRVLVRPGPTDRSGRQQQVDQAKLRAFHTITVILGVLLLKFGGYILVFALYNTRVLDPPGKCNLWISLFWFCLPSNLVLPLLFLLRAGKLRCCETRQQSD